MLPFLSRCDRSSQQHDCLGQLGCGLRAGTTALRSSLAGLRRRTSVQFARGRACVRGGWCVNRELSSVTREIWRAAPGRRKGRGMRDKAVERAVHYCCRYCSVCAHATAKSIITASTAICVHACRIRYDGVSPSHRTDGRSDLISRRDEQRERALSRHTDRPSSGLQVVTRLERDGMSRVGGDVSKLFSPLLFCASAALLLLPCRGAGCHQRRQANGGRERHEALWLK